ncbi:MAG: T9SS type A sorting domain-containing protein [Lewinellaceae bacterium]|nr:T9SS type A sorting domain-containing protein [Lewinellaceae bacterium]
MWAIRWKGSLLTALIPGPLATQFPWHASPVPNPFGLNETPLSVLRLVDFDLDDTTEAIVVVDGGIIGTNVEYFENTGDDAAPDFVYVESYPFGIPQLQSPQMDPFEFIDIDGDGDPDIFLHYQGLETPLAFLENTGTPNSPDFNKPPVAWWANDPPPPPGFDSYALGDWIDIGGDGDMDYIGGSVPGFFFWENVSNNAMACRGYLPEITSFRDAHLDASLTLYPNPAQDMLAFDLQSYDPIGEINIEIFNVLAQRVRNLHRPGFANALQETISLESLADGIYTIRLSSGGKFIVQQFVKIR